MDIDADTAGATPGARRTLIDRLGVLVAGLLWVAALASPYRQVTHAFSAPFADVYLFHQWPGARLAAFGWCVPLFVNAAWFANPLLAISGFRLLARGRAEPRLAVLALALGLTVLLPYLQWDPAPRRFVQAHVSGAAVWLWLAALACHCGHAAWAWASKRTTARPNTTGGAIG